MVRDVCPGSGRPGGRLWSPQPAGSSGILGPAGPAKKPAPLRAGVVPSAVVKKEKPVSIEELKALLVAGDKLKLRLGEYRSRIKYVR
jgi:hypothetical protein